MKIKCEYCNNYIDESEEKCPSCGAPNANYKRVGNQVPTTIEELKQWYADHNLPPSLVTRFFIGDNFLGPKAFGIYKDDNTGKYVVYKNKDTGERAIRYEGNDEAYAVNELYLKLKEEIANQKYNNILKVTNTNLNKPNRKKSDTLGSILLVLFFLVFSGMAIYAICFLPYADRGDTTRKGYYYINDKEYYYGGGSWFIYANDDWISTSNPDYSGNLDDYYQGDDYYNSSDYSDIRDSKVYSDSWDYSESNTPSSWGSSSYDSDDDDWDSGSSWDSDDSWDSGSTDWGSDW